MSGLALGKNANRNYSYSPPSREKQSQAVCTEEKESRTKQHASPYTDPPLSTGAPHEVTKPIPLPLAPRLFMLKPKLKQSIPEKPFQQCKPVMSSHGSCGKLVSCFMLTASRDPARRRGRSQGWGTVTETPMPFTASRLCDRGFQLPSALALAAARTPAPLVPMHLSKMTTFLSARMSTRVFAFLQATAPCFVPPALALRLLLEETISMCRSTGQEVLCMTWRA